MAKFLDTTDFDLRNFLKIQDFRMSLGSFGFIGLILVFDLFWMLFVAKNIEGGEKFATVHFYMILITIASLFFIFVIGRRSSNGGSSISFFPTGKPSFGNVTLSIVISLVVASIFSFATLSISPVLPFTVSSPFSASDFFNFLSISRSFVNYSLFAGINEELALNSFFFLTVIVLQKFLNSKRETGTTFLNLAIAFVLMISAFTALHYDVYFATQQDQYNNYLKNPSLWAQLHPNKPAPADPRTPEGQFQLTVLLLISSAFRLISTVILVIFADLLLAVQTHILVNAALLLFSPDYITQFQFPYFIMIFLMILLVQLLDNLFSSKTGGKADLA